jgi:hypothetical protein
MKTRKRIKRITAILIGLMILFITVKVSSSVSLAYSDTIEWKRVNYSGEDILLGNFSVTTSGAESIYFANAWADYYEDYKAAFGDTIEEYEGTNAIDYYIDLYGYCDPNAECTVVFTLPEASQGILKNNSFAWEGALKSVSVSGNKMTVVVKGDEIGEFACSLSVIVGNSKNTASGSVDDQFWFKPMKTQLAIAADIVATNGGTAVAEASGDFGLSYEIMKYLDDHPGVTLKYTLAYKGEEHLIVIPGGGKFANPEIPWYGPEYLIGYFGK